MYDSVDKIVKVEKKSKEKEIFLNNLFFLTNTIFFYQFFLNNANLLPRIRPAKTARM